MAVFDIRDLNKPVIVAPMAGGPSTPALAAAGTDAGGLGFVAAGYLTAETFAERLSAARALTSGPLGANLFVPQPSVAGDDEVARYAETLAPDARRYGAEPGAPRSDDDAWQAKLDVLLELRPEVASFTFGLPSAEEVARLRTAGIATVGTVTTVDEAHAAVRRGVDVVAVQGPEAGGHRGHFDPGLRPPNQPLDELLAAVLAAVDVPVVAAGGLIDARGVAAVLDAGAVAAQLGTAFLLADESGSSPVHRAALRDPQFTETVVTKAFSGRYARGLRNRFVVDHDEQAPLAYPQVHHLTAPLRAAAVRAGDPQGTNIWAGTGFRSAPSGSVADIMAGLT
ncbi:2-nitropropane dioxygenase [Mycobacterium sp. 852013-51886_SCH5428379]|uniref:nitronate monooxygenase n=1 Tax=Mycobacterium sp. 852013-51886_SCH5428379 TaxID=1834111 RepID=UPI000801D4FC|nr:nitronate monooxygenase [Mycobacterium sp. 852013-51886_SCH5428379]OBB61167.1 2-nitropropane dioxygenase [Mycobacterium sp. 852013-51886_SCH5428379]